MYVTEKATRKKLIDQALMAAGWLPILPYDSKERYGSAAVEEYPTDNGPPDYLSFSSRAPLAAEFPSSAAQCQFNAFDQSVLARAFRGEL